MKITLATSDVTTITLNTDTLANRPLHPIIGDDEGVELATELVVDELSIVIITVIGSDLSLSYSTLLIVETPYT